MRGRIWDVAVDLRAGSPTRGSWDGHELDDEAHRMLFIPVGFAHGFCALSDSADVLYKISSPYDADAEAAIRWNDPQIGIDAGQRPHPLGARPFGPEPGGGRGRDSVLSGGAVVRPTRASRSDPAACARRDKRGPGRS